MYFEKCFDHEYYESFEALHEDYVENFAPGDLTFENALDLLGMALDALLQYEGNDDEIEAENDEILSLVEDDD
jgi:hypothetical protein